MKFKKITSALIAVAINTAAFGALIYTGQELAAQEVEKDFVEYQTQEMNCLALNIYFETHAVSLVDAMSVSDVVLNRVMSKRFPDSVCDVVHQGFKPGKKSCQFSWYCDGKHDTPYDNDAWEKSRKYARDMYLGNQYRGITEGATHYHAHWMKAYWAPSMHRVARMGSHIFYRED
jgi:N-acetylmuramoyl-L-alanine amidase